MLKKSPETERIIIWMNKWQTRIWGWKLFGLLKKKKRKTSHIIIVTTVFLVDFLKNVKQVNSFGNEILLCIILQQISIQLVTDTQNFLPQDTSCQKILPVRKLLHLYRPLTQLLILKVAGLLAQSVTMSATKLSLFCLCFIFTDAFECKDTSCLNGGTCVPGKEDGKLPKCK